MDELQTKIIALIGQRITTSHSEVKQPGRLRGWGEERRVSAYQSIIGENIAIKTGMPYAMLSGTIYEVFNNNKTLIFALYEDGTILWLDDHSDNSDYATFIGREHILDWLPHKLKETAILLTGTKLNYLGMPQLVSSVREVPPIPEKAKAVALARIDGREYLSNQERRLTDVADQISSPMVTATTSGAIQISFYIWTKVFGRVIFIRCLLGPGEVFTYEGTELAYQTGNYAIPH